MDALFSGGLASALISNGQYKFEPIPMVNITPVRIPEESGTYCYGVDYSTSHDIIMVVGLSHGSAQSSLMHGEYWLPIGSSAMVYGSFRNTTTDSYSAHELVVRVIGSRSIRCQINHNAIYPTIPLGYIYEL